MRSIKELNFYCDREHLGKFTVSEIAFQLNMTNQHISKSAREKTIIKKRYMVSEEELYLTDLNRMPHKEKTLKERLESIEEQEAESKSEKPVYTKMPLSGSHGFVWRSSPTVKRG